MERLKERILQLEEQNQKLQASHQRMNEDLIRYRTTSRIYERIYTDLLVGPNQKEKQEDSNE
ncbi:hypothetical protein [Intestinibacillus sp. Marseille-P6563]|uniref:hypothetical protein n=1 Tax=Intestinibacillus sp. Marseille-P6563 TaxID=2364792 RepID=UPI0013DFF7C1|nr:hypothetical protein [Intestinibacillus sp. Marseille-P6563]